MTEFNSPPATRQTSHTTISVEATRGRAGTSHKHGVREVAEQIKGGELS